MGPRSVVSGGGAACERRLRGIRWSHEALYCVENRVRASPLGSSVELPTGTRSSAQGGGTACERS
eukprot:1232379-Pyramimonas_sp.AAC.1